MFHFHKMSDWAITERGDVIATFDEVKIGTYIIQERFCPGCHKIQIRQQATCYLVPHKFKLVPVAVKMSPKHDPVAKAN